MNITKKRDVRKLLVAMGQEENPQIKAFYDTICNTASQMDTQDNDGEDEDIIVMNDDDWLNVI